MNDQYNRFICNKDSTQKSRIDFNVWIIVHFFSVPFAIYLSLFIYLYLSFFNSLSFFLFLSFSFSFSLFFSLSLFFFLCPSFYFFIFSISVFLSLYLIFFLYLSSSLTLITLYLFCTTVHTFLYHHIMFTCVCVLEWIIYTLDYYRTIVICLHRRLIVWSEEILLLAKLFIF